MKKDTTTEDLPGGGLQLLHFLINRRKWMGLSLLVLFLPYSRLQAQRSMDYSILANIIYQLTKYIEWPEARKTGDFIIAVVGDAPLFEELKATIANKRVGSQKIVVKRFSTSQESFDCHILVVPEDETGSLKKIVTRTMNDSILLIGEEEGTAARGACINFRIVQERLKLVINKTNIERRHLSIANELLQFAIMTK
jgi:hypothetical protein